MDINVTGKVEGIYGVKVRRNAGTPDEYLEDFGESSNLILDGFFTRFLSGDLRATNGSWRFFVGTGATAPANGQTQLVAQVGAASEAATVTTNNNVLDGSDYIASSTGVAQWGVGDITGNISEVGANLRSVTAGNALDSRALIVDGGGTPTPITVTASDQLIVSYTLKYKIPIAQHISNVTFGGVSTTCTLETLDVLNTAQWSLISALDSTYPFRVGSTQRISNTQGLFNDVTLSVNTGTSATCSTTGSSTGSARRVTLTAASSQFNQVGDIKYLLLYSASGTARQGILFNPPLAKTNTKTLVLNFDYTLTRA